jgi:hypothetical protein
MGSFILFALARPELSKLVDSMLLILGAFDNSGCPIFKIRVAGSNPSREYVAVIDTAFNGFVAMPISEMIELGLKSEERPPSYLETALLRTIWSHPDPLPSVLRPRWEILC